MKSKNTNTVIAIAVVFGLLLVSFAVQLNRDKFRYCRDYSDDRMPNQEPCAHTAETRGIVEFAKSNVVRNFPREHKEDSISFVLQIGENMDRVERLDANHWLAVTFLQYTTPAEQDKEVVMTALVKKEGQDMTYLGVAFNDQELEALFKQVGLNIPIDSLTNPSVRK